ncbi:MAG: hypothetical protein ACTSX9_04575 [Candidatus Njordarchaeales archaeon]
MPPKHVLYRNMVLSATFLASCILIAVSIALWGSSIGLTKPSWAYDLSLIVILSLIYLFSLILIGTVTEIFGYEPNIIAIGISILIPVVIAYILDFLSTPRQIAGILLGILLVTLYVLFASSTE